MKKNIGVEPTDLTIKDFVELEYFLICQVKELNEDLFVKGVALRACTRMVKGLGGECEKDRLARVRVEMEKRSI